MSEGVLPSFPASHIGGPSVGMSVNGSLKSGWLLNYQSPYVLVLDLLIPDKDCHEKKKTEKHWNKVNVHIEQSWKNESMNRWTSWSHSSNSARYVRLLCSKVF